MLRATPMQTLEEGNKSGRKNSWLELELTVTTIEPGNCQIKSELLHFRFKSMTGMNG